MLEIEQKVNHTEGAPIGFALKVSRKEQDASMKLDVSRYAGKTITVTMHVRTEDRMIRMGLDTGVDSVLAEADSASEWTQLSAVCAIPEDIRAAYIFVETDGAADFYVDDIAVVCGEDGGEPLSEEAAEEERATDIAGAAIDAIDQETEAKTQTAGQEKKSNRTAVIAAAAVVVCAAAGFVLLRKKK